MRFVVTNVCISGSLDESISKLPRQPSWIIHEVTEGRAFFGSAVAERRMAQYVRMGKDENMAVSGEP